MALIGFDTKDSKPSDAKKWLTLSALFCLMSIDEAAQVHEKFGYIANFSTTLNETLGSRSWIFGGLILVFIAISYFWKFVMGLPTRTRNGIFISAALFILGAAGVEVLEAIWLHYFDLGFGYALVSGLPETLEMVGIAYFVIVMLRYAHAHRIESLISFRP